jgi:hypothetical protein
VSDGDVERIPWADDLPHPLGRHVRHDPRSRAFAVPRATAPTVDVRHRRFGEKLNQGSVGACTCFAAVHTLNTNPVRRGISPRPTMRGDRAIALYGRATALDPFPGTYPPDDTGSSGLAACEAMIEAGLISRYEWAFGFDHGLDSIERGPFMQGTWWTADMFHPDADGRVHPSGSDAGGHEYEWVGIEIRSKREPSKNRAWYMNSWGGSWGKAGYFYMTFADAAALLARSGDLIRPIV